MIQIIRKRLKPYQWPIVWTLFFGPWVALFVFFVGGKIALIFLGLFLGIGLYAFLIDCFRKWLDAV